MWFKSVNLYDILTSEEFETIKNSFKCELEVTIQNSEPIETESVTVIDCTYFTNRLKTKFPSWSILVPDNEVNNAQYLLTLWNTFLNESKLVNYAKLYENFSYKYNPIENYDKYSTVKVLYKGTETNTTTPEGKEINTLDYEGSETNELEKTGKEKNTTTYNGSATSTFTTPEGGYTDTTTNSNNPEDSESYYNNSKVTVETSQRNEETTQSFNNRSDENELEFTDRVDSMTREFNNRSDTTTKEFQNRKDTHVRTFTNREDETTDRTHGNIGISTPMDMAIKELNARKYELMPQIISDFIWEYGVIEY